VIAGQSMGVTSQVRTRTPTTYLDFKFQSGAIMRQDVEAGWTTFVYILEGKFKIDDQIIEAHNTVLFTHEGDYVEMENVGNDNGHLVLIAGRPIGEPVAQHGPFVMNTKQEIMQAIEDFQMSKNGFEMAKTWKSVEGNK